MYSSLIWALCQQYQLPETFSVEVPQEEGTEKVEALLNGLPERLKAENLRTLGIVVDADRNLSGRWQSLKLTSCTILAEQARCLFHKKIYSSLHRHLACSKKDY